MRGTREQSRTRNLRPAALLAVGLAATLVLSSCAPLFGLFDRLTPRPAVSEVAGSDFGAQQPRWQACADEMQCAIVQAPLDWSTPEGDRIEIALVKQPALGGASQGTIFVNPGGPGASGVDYISQSIDYAVGQALQENFDIVGWDPRGVGASTPVVCLEDAAMDDYLFGLGATNGLEPGSPEWVTAARAESAEFGEACLENTGPLLAHVDTESTVRDLDMLREIVGDERLHYLGYSYGTYIGARYADAYPERVGRLVLDGAINPTSSMAEVVREQTRGFELSLRAYVTDCLTRASCPVSGTVDEAMAQWRVLLDAVDADPLSGPDGRWVTSGTLLTAIITPLYSQESWPYLDLLYETTSSGDAETALLLADFYYDRADGAYTSNLIPAFSATNCLDYPRELPLDLERMHDEAAELERIAPTIGAFQGFGDVGCADWPAAGVEDRSAAHASGADAILVIGTTGDPATPLRWAEALADQLDSGVLLVFEGEGHTAYGEHPCVNTAVEQYFLEGVTPAVGTVCR
jgi:pimeloyl-ACP methyl ester carboxylesterase